ncbi:MAG: hypothetical protein R3F59_03245, partial [Myxococcota bacterium]
MSLLFAWATVAVAGSKSVTALSLAQEAGKWPIPGLCPGETAQLQLTTTDSAGRTRDLRLGRRAGVTLSWGFGEVSPRGEVRMPDDPRGAWGKPGTVTATLDADPTVQATLDVPLRFDCSVTVDLSGREGLDGHDGTDGASNEQGRGGDGLRGEPGDPGRDGPAVQVHATLVTEPRTGAEVLQVELGVVGEVSRYVAIDPEDGELVVMANGGRGGRGGAGGDAGSG